jgi:nicotinate-nucleotide adenylyltransferase
MANRTLYLGGTFNPVHIGHTRLALECHLHTGAEVVFVPCADPPHKAAPEIAAHHRLAMLQLAIDELNATVEGQRVFRWDLCELERPGLSYTFDTLRHLREQQPYAVLVWVIGMDSLVSLNSWHRWRELTDLANLLVINRPGWQKPESGEIAEWLRERECAAEQFGARGGVAFLETSPVSISSTALRHQLALGVPGKYLVPEPVYQYIRSHQLYLST